MPCFWNSGNTAIGPSPYQLRLPLEMDTCEKAICNNLFCFLSFCATIETEAWLRVPRKWITGRCLLLPIFCYHLEER